MRSPSISFSATIYEQDGGNNILDEIRRSRRRRRKNGWETFKLTRRLNGELNF